MASLKEKIEQAEKVYKETLKRIITLEEKIKAKKFPENQEKEIIADLTEVRKRLADHEAHIRHLKTHNRLFFVLLVIFMGVCCALFMMYVLLFGPPSAEKTETEYINSKSRTRSI